LVHFAASFGASALADPAIPDILTGRATRSAAWDEIRRVFLELEESQ
jgi:hypothetical protein